MADIRELVGNRIRELRGVHGLSQEQLALKCGLDRTYITSVENGHRNISILNVEKVSSAFGLTISEFFASDIFGKNKDD
jgi:transcriptional regulator with XRE-family HTH domain